jgi:hypothetical protein
MGPHSAHKPLITWLAAEHSMNFICQQNEFIATVRNAAKAVDIGNGINIIVQKAVEK